MTIRRTVEGFEVLDEGLPVALADTEREARRIIKMMGGDE